MREDGAILGHGRGGGVNRNFVSDEVYERSIRDALEGALHMAPEVSRIEYLVGSMGCDSQSLREIGQAYALDSQHVRWMGEALPARAASEVAYGCTPHIVVVAGTGSLVAGWSPDGTSCGVGGAGSIVGDEGSAYWIGVRALIRLVESFDGRQPFDEFARELTQALGFSSKGDLIYRVYGGGKRPITRDEMGAVAPHVSKLANAGNPVAGALFRAAATELAFQTNTVIRMLNMRDKQVYVQLYGGVFRAGHVVIEPLREAILDYAPETELLPPLKCTVVGSAVLALRAIGVDPLNELVRQQLLAGAQRFEVI